MSRLTRSLKEGKKVITVELGPPKGTDYSDFIKNARAVGEYATAFNVTDNQRAVMRMSPLMASALLLREGLEPVYQITCRDRNRLAIQSDLLGASAAGVRNVLALTGDHVISGDYPQAKPVFDLDSVQLLYTISRLNEGEDLSGKKLKGPTTLYPGAVVNPSAGNVEIHIWRMKQKIRMGAGFFQTQVLFDTDVLEGFIKSVRDLNTKIIAGVILVKSARMAKFLNENVPGLFVPDWVIKELESTSVPIEAGIRIAAQLVKDFREIADGVHVMAIHEEYRLPDIFRLL
ncbi:MAG: methylenetetrahydrofolate reductase [Oligoflexia bacterium]|nr:methylenetetrahydrofolate reductase [Oligoflexia bacterium]